MKKGILLIATGDKYYMDLAINLAVSIKANSSLPIHLVHSDNGSTYIQKSEQLFKSITVIQDYILPFGLKTQLYRLSPFDATLYLDVDMLILPGTDLEKCMNDLSGTSFAIINKYHKEDVSIWSDPKELRQLTGNQEPGMYHYFSECIYFEKNDETEKYFKEVKQAYEEPGIEYKKIANQMPDELAYTIASMRTGIVPHSKDWCPIFWHLRNRKDTHLQIYQLNKKYIAYSVGGNMLPQYVKASYDNLLTLYENKLQLKGLRRIAEKRIVLRDRIKI